MDPDERKNNHDDNDHDHKQHQYEFDFGYGEDDPEPLYIPEESCSPVDHEQELRSIARKKRLKVPG